MTYLDVLVRHLHRVDALVGPELLGRIELGVVDVHPDDVPNIRDINITVKTFLQTREFNFLFSIKHFMVFSIMYSMVYVVNWLVF